MIVIDKNSREEIRIGREDYQGHDLINVRIWTKTDDPKPTKKGLALNPNVAEQVCAAIQKLLAEGGAQ